MAFQERSDVQRRGWVYLLATVLLLLILLPAAGLLAQEGTGVPTADQAVQSGSVDGQAEADVNGLELTAEVLVIQDAVSWGVDIGNHILAKHGISYEKITSAELAAKDLSVYRMVAMPSAQPEALYVNWNNSFSKIDNYVKDGGLLWLSVANYLATKPQIPGGVTVTSDNSTWNDIALPDHPWARGVPNPAQGNALSAWSLTDVYPGSIIIATSQNAPKRPTLVDYQYGKGRIALNSQWSEHSWYNNYSGGALVPNALIDMLGYRALVIQDQIGWGNNEQQKILNKFKVKFNQITSSQLNYVSPSDKFNVSPYEMLVSVGGQVTTYNTNWNNNFTAINNYVSAGGKLWQSSTGLFTAVQPRIPGGVTLVGGGTPDISAGNNIILPNHPWVRGVPTPALGNHLSYNSFVDLYAKSKIIATSQNSPFRPTLLDYNYGDGRVALTSQTLEYSLAYGWNSGPILQNSLIDLLGAGVVYLPALNKNFCADFGSSEVEPNNSDSQANGQLCWGKTYTGNPNNNSGGASAEDSDWFYFDWNGQGTLSVSITNYLADAQVLLYHQSNTSSYVKWILPQPDKNYSFTYDGAAGAGRYYLRLFAPAGHPTNGGNYNLSVTLN